MSPSGYLADLLSDHIERALVLFCLCTCLVDLIDHNTSPLWLMHKTSVTLDSFYDYKLLHQINNYVNRTLNNQTSTFIGNVWLQCSLLFTSPVIEIQILSHLTATLIGYFVAYSSRVQCSLGFTVLEQNCTFYSQLKTCDKNI